MRNWFAAVLLTGLLLAGFSSCKKGCTNPKAANYDPSAKQEDASCLFCDSTLAETYNANSSMYDNNFGGQHGGSYVLNTNISGNVYFYVGNNCGKLGFFTGCSAQGNFQGFAYSKVTLTNQTNDTMLVSGTFRMTVDGTNTLTRVLTNFTIPPYRTVDYPERFYSDCVENFFTTPSFYSYDVTFSYK